MGLSFFSGQVWLADLRRETYLEVQTRFKSGMNIFIAKALQNTLQLFHFPVTVFNLFCLIDFSQIPLHIL